MDPTFKPSRVIEKEKNEKRKRRRLFFVFLLAILTVSLTYFVPKLHIDKNTIIHIARRTNWPDTQYLHFLFLGIDPYDTPARTDTMIYARFDLKNKVIYMLSVPRDSRVDIPGHGLDKINHAHVFGGTELTKECVGNLLNVKIDYVVLTNIDAFVKAVDELGGVDINVEKRMKYTDKRGGLYIDLQPGLQLLDGEKAMHYVRFRHDAEGDIGRIRRQQAFMKAVVEKALSLPKLPKIGTVYRELRDGVETTLKLSEIAELAYFIRKVGSEHMHMDMVPGTPEMIRGISYWIPYKPGYDKILERMEKGEAYYARAEQHVRLYNKSALRGAATRAKNMLEDEGFAFFSTRTASAHPLAETEVHYKEGKKEYASVAAKILGAKLHDAADVAAVENEPQNEAPDVEIWLGKDIFKKSRSHKP